MSVTTDPATVGRPTLAASSMSRLEVLAQSLAGIAPSAVMATGPALVALGAGGSLLYSYLVSTVVLLLVGWCISQFAERIGEGGTLLSYISSALGPVAGYLGAAALVFGYALIAVASTAGFALYAGALTDAVGLPGAESTGWSVLLYVVCVSLACYAMVRGVQLSTRLGVVLEVVSIAAILVVIAAVLSQQGLSTAPLRPDDLGVASVTGGMVLAILGYVGFESAACMGTEAKDPHRTIPRAVLGSVALVGVLYLLSGYAQLVGFGSGAKITESATPFNDLSDAAGVHPLGYLIDVGAAASFFACVTGSLNAASRLVYSMAGDGLFHPAVASCHARRQTPHLAIVALSGVCLVVAVVMAVVGVPALNVFAYAGTIGTYGYMVAYILIAVGAPVFLHRRREPFAAALVVGVLGALAMTYVLVRNVYPVAVEPYNRLPWIFLSFMALALAWYTVARRLTPSM